MDLTLFPAWTKSISIPFAFFLIGMLPYADSHSDTIIIKTSSALTNRGDSQPPNSDNATVINTKSNKDTHNTIRKTVKHCPSNNGTVTITATSSHGGTVNAGCAVVVSRP